MEKKKNLKELVMIGVLILIIISIMKVVTTAYNENNNAQPIFDKTEARQEINEARKDLNLDKEIDKAIEKQDIEEEFKKEFKQDVKKEMMQWEPTKQELISLKFKESYIEGCIKSGAATKSFCSCSYDYMIESLGATRFYRFAIDYANGKELTNKELNLMINSATYCINNS